LKLEEFVNLKKLDCRDNLITELDLRGCSKLTKLYCSNNPLERLCLDNISEIGWENIQEELKDFLRGKKGEQYYDLQE
jgi:Leucine-rich repeat (LRR) protein